MHTATGHRRAPVVLLVALLVATLGGLLLDRPARAQDDLPCNPLVEDCTTSTTEDDDDVTTTTEDDDDEDVTTTIEDDEDDDVTATTEERVEREEVVEPTTSTFTVTTLHDVLIPGDGTAGAESTTTTVAIVATGDDGISDQTLILVIVGGLAVVAAVAGVLTWRYWGATQPQIVEARERQKPSVFVD